MTPRIFGSVIHIPRGTLMPLIGCRRHKLFYGKCVILRKGTKLFGTYQSFSYLCSRKKTMIKDKYE